MNPAYRHTHFRSALLPGGRWPAAFAVITAHNPRGEIAPKADNDRVDAALRTVLATRGLMHWRVVGAAADDSHAEAGYGVECDLTTALGLGRDLAQVAIFWVEAGELFLVDCASDARTSLGHWTERWARAG